MKLPADMDGRRFLRTMERLGWRVGRQRGSHRVLANDQGRKVIVAFHRRIRRASIKGALRDTGIEAQEFLAAL